MAETSDIQEHNNECPREAVIADCVRRVEGGAMKSELDFFVGVQCALTHYGMEEEADSFSGRIILAVVGRSVIDPSWAEIEAKRAEGEDWDHEKKRWVAIH